MPHSFDGLNVSDVWVADVVDMPDVSNVNNDEICSMDYTQSFDELCNMLDVTGNNMCETAAFNVTVDDVDCSQSFDSLYEMAQEKCCTKCN